MVKGVFNNQFNQSFLGSFAAYKTYILKFKTKSKPKTRYILLVINKKQRLIMEYYLHFNTSFTKLHLN